MNTVTLPEQLTEKKQGKLTVFASYFTGAGKSYSMLESAEQARQAGLDVVIGLLSCEQWPQTQVLADKFEVLPCKTVIRDGQTNYEMDLDACLTRSPELILVNDLCPPSCRHWRGSLFTIPAAGSAPRPQTKWSARYMRRLPMPAGQRE